MVERGCWAVVVVCGRPGMFVVVEVTCGRRGGRWWLRWWCGMKKEAVSPFVTRVILDHERARALTLMLLLLPKFIPYTIL